MGKSSNKPRAVVLADTLASGSPAHELKEIEDNVKEIGAALAALGWEVSDLYFSLDVGAVAAALKERQPDMVFNLVDSVEGSGALIAMAPLLLEYLNIPFTGASSTATATTCDKVITKRLLGQAGIPTAPYLYKEQLLENTPLDRPYILKSTIEHASYGLGKDSVTSDREKLIKLFRHHQKNYGSTWFAEAYIEGREFNISVLATPEGPKVMPAAEMRFTEVFPKDQPRIVDYTAKWMKDSNEYKGTVRHFDFPPQDAKLLKELERIALQCWHAFELNGYTRVDFRVDEKGNPFVLEVNSNPYLSAAEGFGKAAENGGYPFPETIRQIVADAFRRVGKTSPV